MKEATLQEIFELPAKERVRLAKELLESVTADEGPPISAREKAILDERLAEDDLHPDGGLTWSQVSQRFSASSAALR
jgi:putative addiction module component (TIGR02574 family)